MGSGCGNDEQKVDSTEEQVGTCPGGQRACQNGCADVTADGHNCGSCGTVCTTGTACTAGSCECQDSLTLCGGTCVDTQSSAVSCGDCLTACGTGLVCSRGQCKNTCDTDLLACGADCVDPMTNVRHCGSCDEACGIGQACTDGVCSCSPGQVLCEGECVPATQTCGGVGTGGTTSSGGATSAGGASSTGGSGTGGVVGTGGAGTGGAVQSECSNVRPTGTDWDEATCDQWANEAGECDSQWFVDAGYCHESCGKCESSGSGGGENTGGGGGSGGGNGSGGSMGTGNPFGGVDNPEGENHATRYWDCCKPSCGWSSQGNIHSCNLSNSDVGVNDQMQSVCDNGDAQTCHGMAPWAYSSELAFGYAAANGRPCGACYKLEFTGQGHYSASDPGSQAIAGKVMIVKVTNRGAELGDGHFDLLIPGGGLGMFDGCSRALNIDANTQLGARNGGFITSCNGDANCVHNECMTKFANFPELQAGCLWSVDWFRGADNPRFKFQQVDCPQELGEFN